MLPPLGTETTAGFSGLKKQIDNILPIFWLYVKRDYIEPILLNCFFSEKSNGRLSGIFGIVESYCYK